ncbi:MAG: DUF6492 family protein [Planctomycetota bacterium]
MQHDVVIPLFNLAWSTRAVYEGVARHYAPRKFLVIAPREVAAALTAAVEDEGWDVPGLAVYPEEDFFVERFGLTKDGLAAELDLEASLYPPGWFYQQLLKLGADDGIAGLTDWFLIWDSDLLPVATWPVLDPADGHPVYALLQDRGRGNSDIVDRWRRWIETVLGVPALTDDVATFVPHHMWFKQSHLASLRQRLGVYYDAPDTPWPKLMMRSANDFGTFSEFWLYASWAAARHADDAPRYHPYAAYGATTERFFEDGSAPFATALRQHLGLALDAPLRPDYAALRHFIESIYGKEQQPSSLSFEASPRHRKKGRANMHVEELRSRWHNAED